MDALFMLLVIAAGILCWAKIVADPASFALLRVAGVLGVIPTLGWCFVDTLARTTSVVDNHITGGWLLVALVGLGFVIAFHEWRPRFMAKNGGRS